MLDYPSKEAIEKLNQQKNRGASLTSDLKQNIALFKGLFKDDDTFIARPFNNKADPNIRFCIFNMDGLVKPDIINEAIIKPLMLTTIQFSEKKRLDTLSNQVILINEVTKTNNLQELIESVTYGDTILILDGEAEALILNTKYFQLRSVSEPPSEQILSGPREGFNESLMVNLSMIHRRVRSNDLKLRYYTFGRRTKTKSIICYMDSLVNKNILDELYKRLDKIDIDGVLDSNYISELICDNKWSPFRTIGFTERPDVAVSKILEGKIVLLTDGTPVVLTLPYVFAENFQSNEDYYLNYIYSTFGRFLRLISFFIAIATPAFYIALVAYHQEMMPPQLYITIAAERLNVPFPAAIESFLLLIVFDILKETGIRMPSNLGQALSIVGALVIGQAAVEARLVAAPMIIIVAITAITSLLIPKINTPAIVFRYFLLALASGFGYFGFMMGLSILVIHIISIRSFGIPYMTPIDKLSFKGQDLKDTGVRAPWWNMKTRPKASGDSVRLNSKQSGGNN